MTIVWRQKKKGVQYEVRSAGKSRRLYTDGVFHSQYNPYHAVTGQAWDLLMLPAFFYPLNSIKRVLVLGVGGGAVIHLLNRFVSPSQITGIELNKIHLTVARRFFDLNYKNLQLIQADAISWLNDYQGTAFDMIIDDMFTEQNGEPVSVAPANVDWFSLLLKHVTASGIIVKNFIDSQSLQRSAPLCNKSLQKRFANIYQFTHPYNENRIGAYLKRASDNRYLRHRLHETPGLNPRLKTSRLRYQVRKLL